MRVRFWGTRGSFVAPGAPFVRYGGNTPCVEIRAGSRRLILDLGSGAIALGKSLREPGATQTVLLSHTHIDHIQGFPFFAPAFDREARLVIHGPGGAGKKIDAVLDDALNPDFSPLYSIANLSAELEFHSLSEKPCRIEGFNVVCAPLPHGKIVSWGFRIESQRGSIAYITDVEYARGVIAEAAVGIAKDVDLLIHDSHFAPHEYAEHVGWGHSSWKHAVRVAIAARARSLALFHHGPDRTDEHIDAFVNAARQAATRGLRVFGAAEGMEIAIGR